MIGVTDTISFGALLCEKTMRYLLLFTVVVLWVSCTREPVVQEVNLSEAEKQTIADVHSLSTAAGEALLSKNCYSCHNPESASHDDMLAPPLAGIKNRYQMSYPERTAFIHQMASYIAAPAEEHALMRGPVRRFGVMPPVALPKDSILAVAAYIYDNELPAPAWFQEHFEEKHGRGWGKGKGKGR